MVMTSLKWRHNYILKFDFIIISFKNHYLSKSRNFRSPILKIKRHWGLTIFWKSVTKIVHFLYISQLKFSLKIWNNILIEWGPGPPGYALAQDLKKLALTEKIGPAMPVLPSQPKNRKKNLIITCFLVKFCFIQNKDFKNWNLVSSKIRILRSFRFKNRS